MPSIYTERDKGLLSPQEARQVLMEYRQRIGVPINTVEPQKTTDHPMAQEILVELGQVRVSCQVCNDARALRLPGLPVNHPQFGRLARCWHCSD